MDLDIFEFERSNILDKYFYKRDSHGLVTNNRYGLVFLVMQSQQRWSISSETKVADLATIIWRILSFILPWMIVEYWYNRLNV